MQASRSKEIRLSTTILVPYEWKQKIDSYMKELGYKSFPEMVRDWIRKFIIATE